MLSGRSSTCLLGGCMPLAMWKSRLPLVSRQVPCTYLCHKLLETVLLDQESPELNAQRVLMEAALLNSPSDWEALNYLGVLSLRCKHV